MSHLQLHCTIEKEKNTGIKSGGGGSQRERVGSWGGGAGYTMLTHNPLRLLKKK